MYRKLIILILLITLISCKNEDVNSLEENLNFAVESALKGEFNTANDFLDRAFDQSDDNLNENIYLIKAKIQELEGVDKEDILTSLRNAAKYAPESYKINYEIGKILYKQKKYQDSISCSLKANEADKTKTDAILLLAKIYKELDAKESIKYYKILLKTKEYKNNAAIYNEIGCRFIEINQKKENIDEASKYIYKAYKLSPKNHQIIYNFATLCDVHLDKKKYAIAYYKKYYEKIKKNPELIERSKKLQLE